MLSTKILDLKRSYNDIYLSSLSVLMYNKFSNLQKNYPEFKTNIGILEPKYY